MNASTTARAIPVVEPRKRIVTKNERREGERGECDRVYQRLAGDENESFTHATSVIMHVDVKIVIITLVAYARRHYNATSVIITISTSTCIITLVASQ